MQWFRDFADGGLDNEEQTYYEGKGAPYPWVSNGTGLGRKESFMFETFNINVFTI